MGKYKSRELNELLDYCLQQEKETYKEYNDLYEVDREEALLCKGQSEAYHNVVHEINELLK